MMLKLVFGAIFLMTMQEPRTWVNWNGVVDCQIESLFTPSTQDELVALVQRAKKEGKRVKVIGSGHSLSPIALPEKGQWTVSLEKYANILEIDIDNQTITAQGGTTLKQINEALAECGLALENLGSISEQTVGGVIQTGTHGTGSAFGPLHTQVVAMTLVNGKGDLKTISQNSLPLLFQACQCSLGTFGIVNTVTLRAVVAQNLCEKTYAAIWPDVLDQVDDLIEKNTHFRFYWFPYTNCAGIWTANPTKRERTTALKDLSAFSLLIKEIGDERPDRKIESLEDVLELGPTDPYLVARFNRSFFEADYGIPYERVDRSDRIFNVDCDAHAHCCAMEAAFPVQYTKAFLLELQQLIEKNHFPAHTGVEIRFVKGDQALISPTYTANPTDLFCFVSVVSIRPNNQPIPYQDYFQAFRQLSEKYQGRLHWGKMGEFEPSYLKQIYPHWETFRALQKEEDPDGMFLNSFTRDILDLNSGLSHLERLEKTLLEGVLKENSASI